MKFTEYLRLNESEDKVQPKNKDELMKIIKDAIQKDGSNCNLNFIDTRLITDMSDLFANSKFNGDISGWDVHNVKDMSFMFEGAKFNGDISDWKVQRVKSMRRVMLVHLSI